MVNVPINGCYGCALTCRDVSSHLTGLSNYRLRYLRDTMVMMLQMAFDHGGYCDVPALSGGLGGRLALVIPQRDLHARFAEQLADDIRASVAGGSVERRRADRVAQVDGASGIAARA